MDGALEHRAPRRRASAEKHAAAKAATRFSARYREQLGVWYLQLARLRAYALRSDLVLARTEASAVLSEVIRARRRLVKDLAIASDTVRTHSMVGDLERALSRLERELRDLSGVTE